MKTDEIGYTIYGENMRYMEIELDPGESAVAASPRGAAKMWAKVRRQGP